MSDFRRYLLLIVLVGLAACSPARVLAPTPNVFANGAYPHAEIVPALQTAQSQLFFITDRKPIRQDGALTYGSERSSSMAFGVSNIAFGDGTDWQDLATASGAVKRAEKLPLNVIENRELLRFDSTPIPFRVSNGRPVRVPEAVQSYNQKRDAFQTQIREQLHKSGKNEVVIFVHGFNNAFEDAMYCLLYTSPSPRDQRGSRMPSSA